jgi:putative membrane protein
VGYDWGWGGWLVMSVMMLLFWGLIIAAIIAAIIALVRYLGGTRQDGPSASSSVDRGRPNSEELLDERFARGEIDEDEYTRRRQLLRTGR